MPGRGPQTFKKRQKEQQRRERQQEKMAKRMQRKEAHKLSLQEHDNLLPPIEPMEVEGVESESEP